MGDIYQRMSSYVTIETREVVSMVIKILKEVVTIDTKGFLLSVYP